jgi:hypothetical protein
LLQLQLLLVFVCQFWREGAVASAQSLTQSLMMHITLLMSDQTFCICHRLRCHLLIRSAQSHTWVQAFFIYVPKCHTQVYAILDKRNGFGCSVEQSAHNITCKVQAALRQWTSELGDSSFCEGCNTIVVMVIVATV